MQGQNITPFALVYDSFLTRVTSEMYMEMTELDTLEQLQSLLLNALNRIKLPRFDVYDYEEGYLTGLGTYNGIASDYVTVPVTGWVGGFFNSELTEEEINLLSLSMVIEWFGQQLAITENTRLQYSGSDYKFTSQANHMAKLKNMIELYKTDFSKLQDTYKRRTRIGGKIRSSLGKIMIAPSYGANITREDELNEN